MPPKPFSQHQNVRHEGHEDRIQRLEDRYTDIKGELVEQTVMLDHLKDALETGIESVVSRIECAVAPLSENVEAIRNKMDQHENELRALKIEDASRRQTYSTIKKGGFWFVAVVGGGCLAKAGEWLWVWLTR